MEAPGRLGSRGGFRGEAGAKRIRRVVFVLCISSWIAVVFAEPEERVWSVRFEENPTATILRPYAVNPLDATAAQALTFSADRTLAVARFNLDTDVHPFGYGLRVDGLDFPTGVQITLNDQPVTEYPVLGRDALYWYVPESLLTPGVNTLSLRESKTQLLTAKAVELFALSDFTESNHFAKIYADPQLLAQPAAHPEQLKYDMLHYDLDLKPDMTKLYLTATATVSARSLDSTLSTFVLDFDRNGGQMIVDSVQSYPSLASLAYTLDGTNRRLLITLPGPVAAGTDFAVRVAYRGIPNQSTGVFDPKYAYRTHNSIPLVYTFSEPYGARTWFPCKDIPDDKTTATLRYTVPSAYMVVSNGSLDEVITNPDGTKTHVWNERYPLSTYLISFGCTNYEAVSTQYTSRDGSRTMELTHWVYPESKEAEKNAAAGTLEALVFFADLFGEYPFLREKYTTYTHGSGSGMEHQTCTGMPNLDLGDGRQRRNVHELAHQWFGDAITMHHFNHLWLNEGFATYAEALWTEHTGVYGTYKNYVSNWSVRDTYPIVSDSADNFSGYIVYRKGAWVLHMLRRVVGDTAFFLGLRSYFHDPRFLYGTALSEDFQKVMEAASGMDLQTFFQQWLYRASRPRYSWSWSTHAQGGNNMLNLYITQTQTGDVFDMPVDFHVGLAGGGTRIITVRNTISPQEFHIDLGASQPTSVAFDPDNWILKLSQTQVSPPAIPVEVATSTPTPTPAPSFTPTPSWTPTPTESPTPTPSPTPSPSSTPSATPSPSPTASATPSPIPTPDPGNQGFVIR